jgi:2-amino-4-hydroxy-6-hydroxymethyldihydropteridine diphosphokinase
MKNLNKKTCRIALGLGSNLGDRGRNIREAVARLYERGVVVASVSSLVETEAVGCPPGAPNFLNAALVGRWSGTPETLLDACQEVEQELGRPADHGVNQSRTMDIDILLLGDRELNTARLTVPHPRLTRRRFVLDPLAEIAPDWSVPGTGNTVGELFDALREDR